MKNDSVFLDICRGYSTFDFLGREIYVKHPSVLDFCEFTNLYERGISKFAKQGKQLEKDIISSIIRQGKWSSAKEQSISSLYEDIVSMEKKKREINNELQIDGIYDAISSLIKKRSSLLEERSVFLENSAESSSYKENLNHQLHSLCYTDSTFSNQAFSKEDLDYMEEYYLLLGLFIKSTNTYSDESIKKLCVSTFFKNLYSLSSNLYNLFGKPIVSLTHPQVILLSYSENFCKAAIDYNDYPDEYLECPDKIIMWAFFRRNGGVTVEERERKERLEMLQNSIKKV